MQRNQGREIPAVVRDGRLDVDAEFDAFVARGSRRLLRSAYLLTGDRGQAEDLLQVTFARLAGHWAAARPAPDAYAHRVLVNLLHDQRRWLSRRVRERPLAEFDERPSGSRDPAEAVGERDAIIAAVKRLAPRQREVVVLRFWADLSVAETAAAIGASEGSVKTHTSRALNKLREVLGETASGPSDETKEVPGAE